ncbi:membrane protein [Kitasatospora herbaricolor]|uniref:Bax inhibitor-1/YccA family protein n=1 Tax=Kitasatospora herbaricolor TaxID=68217 RepID=UPI001749F3A7|nr:Bax inhibitor-1/YccA family protein [Kitasatospora herbaricolor]MDQ0306261.1 putative YccA/Bax inhibitor family protein [Kitasatospora herbaricolor]GGV42747.1 membrane protein [Kitasatospora herbaricolor]
MRTSNPILSRRGISRIDAPGTGVAEPRPVGLSAGSPLPGDRPRSPYAGFDAPGPAEDVPAGGRPMTLDDVVVRTAATLGTVALAAVLSWILLPVDETGVARSYAVAVGCALVAVVLSLLQTFRRRPSPVLILCYAAFEGVFVGVLSDVTSTYIAPGVVVQAVLGTLTVSAGVLIAYRMRWIRVTARFSGFVLAAATGFVLLTVADLLFSAFGGGNGLGFDSGGIGIAFGVAGIVLGACFLALDFRQVEDAVADGAPREEAWLAAFGLTLTLVWIYLEALRVLTLLRGDD